MAGKTEISHPLLWTLGLIGFGLFLGYWFSTLMDAGRRHGIQNPVQAAADTGAGPSGPDHMELISALDGEALARGETVYTNNCASCHGKDGQLGLGGARKLGTEPLQNDKFGPGANPLGMYEVLTKGWAGGAMPAQAHLSPEDRYAVTHYVREAFMTDWEGYRPLDDAYLADLADVAPAPAGAATEVLPLPGVDYPHPAEQPLEIPVAAVMAEQARQAASPVPARAVLLQVADLAVDPALRSARDGLVRLAASAVGAQLVAAVAAEDRATFIQQLAAPAALQQSPVLALLSPAEAQQLYAIVGRARQAVVHPTAETLQ